MKTQGIATMCCSRPAPKLAASTRARVSATTSVRTAPRVRTVIFEYVGSTALTVVSPITRRVYRFDRPGARVEIDARDRSWVTFVPNVAALAEAKAAPQ
jgi:hypothetical protein